MLFILATPARSTDAYPAPHTGTAKGHVPHLADAQEDWYSALFGDVDVGIAWRCRVISEMQGPIYLACLSTGRSELGLSRDVLVGDEVLHGFDGLSKTLDCTPAAHGSGTTVVRDCIDWILSRVDDRRHQLCCQQAVIDCILKLYLIGSASRRWPPSHVARKRHGMPVKLVRCWMSHGMSTSLVIHCNSTIPLAVWQDAPPTSLRWLRTSWVFLCHVRLFLCHCHRMK